VAKILFRNIARAGRSRGGQATSEQWREAILNELRALPRGASISVQEIMEQTERGEQAVWKHLNRLEEDRAIVVSYLGARLP